jgi:cytoskeletal protein CcmA (bactofilin family)
MFFSNKKKQPAKPAKGQPNRMTAEPSFIGRNCIFEGQIACDGELHIDGTIRGSVEARICVVDTAGLVQGTVSGEVVHIRGRVLGPIQGTNVYIHAGAHVEGDVFNDTISIENGAFVYGSIKHNSVSARPKQPPVGNGTGPNPLQAPRPQQVQPGPGPGPQVQQPQLRVVETRKKS